MKYFAGWGTLLEQCFDELCHFIGERPDFICDNAIQKHGRKLHGVPCINFDTARNDPDAEFFITVRNYHGIARQIENQGHRCIRIVHFERGYYKLSRITLWDNRPIPSLPFPTDFFRGKNIFISGASRGLGASLAVHLAALGANLTLHARRLEHLKKIQAACKVYGQEVAVMAADLEDQTETQALIDKLMHTANEPDILYNNAAVPPKAPANQYQILSSDFERSFRINTIAPILLANAFLPAMLARKFGRIVNVSTESQHRPAIAAYTCSKAALDKFVFDLAPTLDGTGVAINLVNPGALRTDMNPTGAQPVESAINGLLVAALLEQSNGCWISAQDYNGLSLDEAHAEAITRLNIASP